jgi:hypothetical protein
MLARKLEQGEPLIYVGREDRIARHPVGKFRVVEWCVRVDGRRTPGCVLPLLDRVSHRCYILETGNDSFRFKNSSAKAAKPAKEKRCRAPPTLASKAQSCPMTLQHGPLTKRQLERQGGTLRTASLFDAPAAEHMPEVINLASIRETMATGSR